MISTTVPPQARTPAAPACNETEKLSLLLVDDSPLDRRRVDRLLEPTGRFRTRHARHGKEALAAVAEELPRIILTDLQMPEMNGLELVEAVCRDYPLVPVVLMTATGSEAIAVQALRQGAASYVPKQQLGQDLVAALDQVLAASKVDGYRQRVLQGLNRRESHFRLESDPALVPALVELLQDDLAGTGLVDATARTRVGVALEEALLNALYHGNLELGAPVRHLPEEERTRLVAQRRQHPAYRNRRLHVYVNLVPTDVTFVIRDEGPGFRTDAIPDVSGPAYLENAGGRGLLLIHTFMDRVLYNGTGNQVTLIKRRQVTRDGSA